MNALHDALHQFVRLSAQSDPDYTELAKQLEALQQCYAVGINSKQLARLLTVLFEEAEGQTNRARYVRQELEFEAKLLASDLDRRTLAIQAVGEADGTDADWALSDTRALRRTSSG